jgi:hypothetical protein
MSSAYDVPYAMVGGRWSVVERRRPRLDSRKVFEDLQIQGFDDPDRFASIEPAWGEERPSYRDSIVPRGLESLPFRFAAAG